MNETKNPTQLTAREAQALAWSDAQPVLDRHQLGHLRHIQNLAAQVDGDWSLMGGSDPAQEWLDSYRYQLAYMAYALGVAHYHRLPAAPCAFRDSYQAIMRKMMRRDVWGYWQETSQSGVRIDPGLEKLRETWIDPIVRENIMYSGHLHAMAGMYAVLFDDDRYARPGGLSLQYKPIFYGMGPQAFEYDFHKVNDVIYWQMVENGWLGVACEPNCIFLVCNQFPMLGFRFHDVRHGTQIADEATSSYARAWAEKGMFQPGGAHFHSFWMQRQDAFVDLIGPGTDTWVGSVMNAWNPKLVQSLAPNHADTWFKHHDDGRVTLHTPAAVRAKREAAAVGKLPVNPIAEDHSHVFTSPHLGYAAMWASEMGQSDILDGILAHADGRMKPTWRDGGLYYAREDRSWDAEGNQVYMEPLTGNALLAYARMNVTDGLRALYEKPWNATQFAEPALTSTSEPVDVLKAVYSASNETLALTLRARDVASPTQLGVRSSFDEKDWTVLVDGRVVARKQGTRATDVVKTGRSVAGELLIELPLDPTRASDVVVCWS